MKTRTPTIIPIIFFLVFSGLFVPLHEYIHVNTYQSLDCKNITVHYPGLDNDLATTTAECPEQNIQQARKLNQIVEITGYHLMLPYIALIAVFTLVMFKPREKNRRKVKTWKKKP